MDNENGCLMLLRRIGTYVPNLVASRHLRHESSWFSQVICLNIRGDEWTEIFRKCRRTDVLRTLLPSRVIVCACVPAVPASIRLPHPPSHPTPRAIPQHLHAGRYVISYRFTFHNLLLIINVLTYSYTHITLLRGLKLTTSLHQA